MTYVIALPCVDECPVEAIHYEDDVPDRWVPHIEDSSRFFAEVLPGLDTPLVAGFPPQSLGGKDDE